MIYIAIFLIGLIVGAVGVFMIFKSSCIRFHLEYIKADPMRGVVVCLAIFFGVGVIFRLNVIVDNAFEFLTIISSIGATWFLTKYSDKISNEKARKELSAISYKHSVGVKTKIKSLQDTIKMGIEIFKVCNNKDDGCRHIDKLNNIEHMLEISLYDIESVVSDWEGEIWQEIELYKDISKINETIYSLEMEKGNIANNSEIKDKDKEIKDKDKEIKEYKQEKNLQIRKCGHKVYNHIKSSETNKLEVNKDVLARTGMKDDATKILKEEES